MLKKFLSVLAVSGLVLTLSACGGNDTVETEETPIIIGTSPTERVEETTEPDVTAPIDVTEPADPATTEPSDPESTVSSDDVDAVANFAFLYIEAADNVDVDLGAFETELEAALGGQPLDNEGLEVGASPEEVFASLTPEQMAKVLEVSEKHNPLSDFFDFSNATSIQESAMVHLLVTSLSSIGSITIGEETPELESYSVDYGMIEINGDTAILPAGTIESDSENLMGEIPMQLNRTSDGWKIDSAAWYASAMAFTEE